METEQPSAQAGESQASEGGLQARINELVAKQRQAEERDAAAQKLLMEQSAQMAQLALQVRQPVAPAAQPADPLAPFKETLDPVAAQAIQAAIAETRRQMEAQYQPMFAQQAAQIAAFAVQAEASAIPNLPKEVKDRAAQLASNWRAQGLNFPPGDALNFALGEYQRGQLLKAAPVVGYNPAQAATQAAQHVAHGQNLPPPAPKVSSLPANFDNMTRAQQLAALEAAGVGDQPI